MKILILDIETTGFYTKSDAIVEIGIVLVDTKTKKTEIVFNETIKENHFSMYYHKISWIFNNSTLTTNDVLNSRSLNFYRDELQTLFDKYVVTAFNKSFDLRFMRDRGFVIKDTKCLLKASRPYWKAYGTKKRTPSFEDVYQLMFFDSEYVEKHRGIDDAIDESKILIKLCEIKEEMIKIKS